MRRKDTTGKETSSSKKQQQHQRPSNASTSTSSRRRRSDSGRRRQHDDLGVEPVDGQNRSKPRSVKGIRKFRKLNGKQERTQEETGSTYNTNNGTKDTLDRDKPVSNDQKQCFEEFARDALGKGIKGVLEEYATQLAPYIPPGMTRKAFDSNPQKNRYADVVCIDQTRIVLKNMSNDYIHANTVQGGPLLNSFICTQGPMMGTVKDFWRMIAQEQVGNIIMLCDTIEAGKEKCQQYWPREEGCAVEWPGIFVKNIKVDKSDSTTIVSTLEVTMDKKDKFMLKHHHWRTWPDKSVPASVLAPFRVLKNVRHSTRPTVVHCSAGIGRTGSVVALECCYQQILSEQNLCVLDMIKWIRQQRMHSVQTDTQYLYLFKCLITFATKYKLIPKDLLPRLQKFDEDYQRIIDGKNKEEKKEMYAPLVIMKK